MKYLNKAFVAKLSWKVLTNGDKTWVQILSARYLGVLPSSEKIYKKILMEIEMNSI